MKNVFKTSLLLCVALFTWGNIMAKNEPFKAEMNTNFMKSFIAKHGMTSKQYQDNFNKFSEKYRLTAVDGYLVDGKVYYAALWKKGTTNGLVARHGLTGKQYQDEFNKWHSKGYRLVHIDGYSDGNKARYAAIWKKGSASGIKARHGLTGKQYQDEFTANHNAGYKLIQVSGYGIKGKVYYAAIWKKGNNKNYVARHGLTSKQYQDVFDKYSKQGFKVTHIDSYDNKGKVYYACIMNKVNGRYSARHDMNSVNYQLQFDNHYYQGFAPVSISGHANGKKAGYAASFKAVGGWKYNDVKQLDDKITAVLKSRNIPGVSIAIVKDGKLVYAKGYGYGVKNKEIASATSLFRLASISKPITSVAVMKLVEQNKIKLTDKVFGPGRILGTQYGTQPYSSREKAITVKHLLEHTAGGKSWDNDSGSKDNDTWDAAMLFTKKESYSDLFKRILDTRNPTHTPGTYHDYSNFGYCVLGRIIDKKSNLSYEDFVKKYVLKPSGITRMQIGSSDKNKRKYKEVVYYGSPDPYKLQMRKMDAHGGWIASSIDLMRFMVRVDGQPSKNDIITKTTFNVMTNSTLNNGYAKGWRVNSTASRIYHTGGMYGTSTVLNKMNNSVSYAILSNSRSNGKLSEAIEDGIKAIKTWPNLDLF